MTYLFHDSPESEIGSYDRFGVGRPQFVLKIPVVIGKKFLQEKNLSMPAAVGKGYGGRFVHQTPQVGLFFRISPSGKITNVKGPNHPSVDNQAVYQYYR